MRSSIRFSLLAAIAITAVARSAAAHPAAAQHAAAQHATRPAVQLDTATDDGAVRTLATYRFDAWRPAGVPAEVMVADSAGTLVARYRTAGSATARPLAIAVLGADVILTGHTPAGVLTLELYGQNRSAPDTPLVGRWMVGNRGGELYGRTRAELAVAPQR